MHDENSARQDSGSFSHDLFGVRLIQVHHAQSRSGVGRSA